MNRAQATDATEPPPLDCCQGQPPPEPVVRGWAHLVSMSTSVQQAFTEILTESVTEPDEAVLSRSLAGFCETHRVDQEEAFTALKACQFLLHRASALDLDGERFAEDLRKLSGEEMGALRLVASRYEPLKRRVREELLVQTLADHGKVLTDLDWRVDNVSSSDRAVGLNAPVVFLTLHVRDAGSSERMTVQLTTRSINMLRQFCQRFSDG